jgi:excisionase family DNA binding protein
VGRGAPVTAPSGETPEQIPRFMTVKQVADYLQVNEKKVYELASDRRIPGTKITGKWLFPRELVDRWLVESSHGGVLTDRLIVTGGDDPLLQRVVVNLVHANEARTLIAYTATTTQLGLSLLAQRRADACGIHWGPAEESHVRHPALLARFTAHEQWILVRAFRREQGLMFAPRLGDLTADLETGLRRPLRWTLRPDGAGSQRFFKEALVRFKLDQARLEVAQRANTEREAAASIAMGQADIAPGTRSAAAEFGLRFATSGWEAFDLALHRPVFFRTLFQQFLDALRASETKSLATALGGYDLTELGQVMSSR